MLTGEVIKLAKIEVWTNASNGTSCANGIRLTLSNGKVSPYFKTSSSQNGPVTINVPANETIKSLKIT